MQHDTGGNMHGSLTTLYHTAPHCTTLHHTAPHCTTTQVAICMGAACLYFNRQRFKRNSKSSHEFQSSAENGKNTTHQHLLHSFGDKLHAPSAYVSVVSADDCVPQCET